MSNVLFPWTNVLTICIDLELIKQFTHGFMCLSFRTLLIHLIIAHVYIGDILLHTFFHHHTTTTGNHSFIGKMPTDHSRILNYLH